VAGGAAEGIGGPSRTELEKKLGAIVQDDLADGKLAKTIPPPVKKSAENDDNKTGGFDLKNLFRLPGLRWLARLFGQPDYRGIQFTIRDISPDTEYSWETTYFVTPRDPRGKAVDLEGISIPNPLVSSGYAVQAQGYNPITDTDNFVMKVYNFITGGESAFGPAQVSHAQMTRYGLDGLDPTNPEIAQNAMAVRIASALSQCPDCSPKDKLIIAGIAQNGDFITPELINRITNNAMVDGNINWDYAMETFVKPSPNTWWQNSVTGGLDYDTQYMVKLFLQDMLALHDAGWELPYDLATEDIENIIEEFSSHEFTDE
jgi:hypothetical protein